MNPAQTLQEIYSLIAEIKLQSCGGSNNDNPPELEDTIQSLPYLNQSGGVDSLLDLEKRTELQDGFNEVLATLSFFLNNAEPETKKRIINDFDLFVEALDSLQGVPLSITFIDAILSHLLSLFFPLKVYAGGSPSTLLYEGYGVAEVVIPSDIEKIKLEILEYPDWIGKEFFYFSGLPDKHNLMVRQACYCFFYSSGYQSYVSDKFELYQISKIVKIPVDADLLLLWALDSVKVKVTGLVR